MTLEVGTIRGHQVVQVGMSDDGLPIFACRACNWQRVGQHPELSCATKIEELKAAQLVLLAAGDGRDLASPAADAMYDHLNAQLRELL